MGISILSYGQEEDLLQGSLHGGLEAGLPSEDDRAFIASLQGKPIFHPEEMAHWITAPKRGINGQPVNWEYVRVED